MLARSEGVWWESLPRADGLALGGLLAALRFQDREPIRSLWRPGLALGMIRLAAIGDLGLLCVLGAREGFRPEGALFRYPVLTLLLVNVLWLGLIDVVLASAGRPSLGLLRLRPLRRLGVISYGLYLYHLPVLFLTLDLARIRFAGQVLLPSHSGGSDGCPLGGVVLAIHRAPLARSESQVLLQRGGR
jgi:peptidoglycan/LPS O-acetylase OafA/YrhL